MNKRGAIRVAMGEAVYKAVYTTTGSTLTGALHETSVFDLTRVDKVREFI